MSEANFIRIDDGRQGWATARRPLASMASRIAVMIFVGIAASCSPNDESTSSVNRCATELYPSYNPKVREQCVAVCIRCDHGTTTTCSTSCNLKGAR